MEMKHLRLAVLAALTASLLGTAACSGNDRARVSPDGLGRAVSGRAQGTRAQPRQNRGGGSTKEQHDNGRRGNGGKGHENSRGNGNGHGNGNGRGNGHHE
jgi:hypothetical protein